MVAAVNKLYFILHMEDIVNLIYFLIAGDGSTPSHAVVNHFLNTFCLFTLKIVHCAGLLRVKSTHI